MRRSFNKTLVSLFSFVVFIPFYSLAADENATARDDSQIKLQSQAQLDLTPLPKHLRASRYIAYYMKTNHYKKQGLNNHQSSLILDRYIETLDGNKAYFLASDIKEFEKYRYRLDDAIYSGLVQPAFHIYRVFKQRWDERNQFALEVLKQPMDFTKDEVFEYDREEAPWATSNEELDNYWRLRVKNDALNLVLAGKEMEKVKELLEKRYKASLRRVAQINSEDVFSYFMNAFTATVDPHSAYFSPRTAENFDIDMKLSLEGIGAVLETNDVYTKIRSIVSGGPADKSKQLSVDDKIIAVGQGNQPLVDVVGWRLDDVVDLIRGDAGSQVRLEIEPANASVNGKTKVISIIREKVKLEEQAAKSEVIKVGEGDKQLLVGVIELPKFYIDFEAKNAGDPNYKSTTRDIKKLITQMKKEDQIDAIIIDLRNNGGGSLGEAIGLTGLFIDKGPVVQEKRLQGRVLTLYDEDEGVAWDGPLAVLVNGSSASASEIFAGAIQDYDRGIIVGEQTFGKGTVQNIIDLNYALRLEDHSAGVLKLTIDKFYRITGASTQLKGVMPDIGFPDPISREHFGEASYDYALQWDTIQAVKYRAENRVSGFVDYLNQKHLQRIKEDREFQYIIQDVEELNKRRQDTSVSLNLEKRQLERTQDEQKRLERENVRRKLLGKEPLEEIDEDTELVEVDDVKLYETAHILSDLLEVKTTQKMAQTNFKKAQN